jgi:Hint module
MTLSKSYLLSTATAVLLCSLLAFSSPTLGLNAIARFTWEGSGCVAGGAQCSMTSSTCAPQEWRVYVMDVCYPELGGLARKYTYVNGVLRFLFYSDATCTTLANNAVVPVGTCYSEQPAAGPEDVIQFLFSDQCSNTQDSTYSVPLPSTSIYSDTTCSSSTISRIDRVPGVCQVAKPLTNTNDYLTSRCFNAQAGSIQDFSNDVCTTAAGTNRTFATSSACSIAGPISLRMNCNAGIYCKPFNNDIVNFATVQAVAGCFSGESTAELSSGERVPVSQLNIGDMVLAVDAQGNTVYDKVFRVTHWKPEELMEYVAITTDSGKTIKMSGMHYLHANQCCDLDNMTKAADIRVGDYVFTKDAELGQVQKAKVIDVRRESQRGAYNVHTLSGSVVVDDVAASHFTTSSSWKHKSWASMWYRVADLFSSVSGVVDNAKLEHA